MERIKVGIIGGAGYTGGELIRLLLIHPNISIQFIHSRSNAGKHIAAVHEDLLDASELFFTNEITTDVDVMYLCLGHGESKHFLISNNIPQKVKIIDLTNDFRLNGTLLEADRNFVYGLPEIHKQKIKSSNSIANPGCFATAIQLSLLPLINNISLSDVYITGITGSTGAGQSLNNTSHFSWRANNIQPYKTLVHQHLDEIVLNIQSFQPTIQKQDIHFVPWRGDFTRGIFTTSQVKTDVSLEKVYQWYENYYRDHPFTIISREAIHLKQVVNTNKCILHLESDNNTLVIHAAIDNLIKGAVGQAIQNMNLMFDLPETTGLVLKASYF